MDARKNGGGEGEKGKFGDDVRRENRGRSAGAGAGGGEK